MNLIALELPEEIDKWPAWLEQQIVGSNLRRVVRQLEIVTGPSPTSIYSNQLESNDAHSLDENLRELLGEELKAVLNLGLSRLSQDRLIKLVQQPRLLLALQELVFVEGGAYWQTVPRSDIVQQSARRIQQLVQCRAIAATASSSSPAEATKLLKRPKSDWPRVSRRVWVATAALAACALLMLSLWRSSPTSGRYFARASLLSNPATGTVFTQQLAIAIKQDWQAAKLPNGLVRELTALRDSCDLLLAAELKQLAPAAAADLKGRCQKWRDTFTGYLNELRSGTSLEEVRTKADATVERLIVALNSLG